MKIKYFTPIFVKRGYIATGKGKNAFTLAEVLITLGIIGVVAAMTIPTLISNYNNKVNVVQLKKSYSMVQNAIHMARNVNYAFDLSSFREVAKLSCDECYGKTDSVEFFKQYLKIVDSCSRYMVIDGLRSCTDEEAVVIDCAPNGISMFLSDGSSVIFGHTENFVAIDVNSSKGPNTLGRDKFVFRLGENGELIPRGSTIHSETYKDFSQGGIITARPTWKDETNGCVNGNLNETCTARIIEQGWKMDY